MAKAITDAIKKKIFDQTEVMLSEWCYNIMYAAINARAKNKEAHDITGNLLNSIIVGLYREGKPLYAYYSGNAVHRAKYKKMSHRTKRPYHFYVDYQGDEAWYLPEVFTNKGWGFDDALNFFAKWKPKNKKGFEIVVAYTTEYANFVENERSTTGILETRRFVENTAVSFLKLD